jgi:sugar/nucleoside kinase (ribokinase family)
MLVLTPTYILMAIRPVIDTNGAGDSLAVGFLSSYVLNNDALRDAILRGQIAARYMCTQKPIPGKAGASVDFITPEKLAHYFHKLS